jgi:hypothetical protein
MGVLGDGHGQPLGGFALHAFDDLVEGRDHDGSLRSCSDYDG